MALLVDPPRPERYGRRWSHLVSDASLDELHEFAGAIGIPRRAFEGDHYDIPEERYPDVVAAGARPTSARDLIRSLIASGLRMPKRRGDTGIARVRGVILPDGVRVDVDLIASPREVAPARAFAATALVRDAAGDLAVEYSVWRAAWGASGRRHESGEALRENVIREVREDVGLVVDDGALRPLGYARFGAVEGSGPWTAGRDLVQLYGVSVPEVRPPLLTTHDGTSDRRWVTRSEFAALYGDAFWWPLLDAALTRPGG
ncbi:MAG: DUF4031 domain-containing protein [Dermatophilaceae bacterium]